MSALLFLYKVVLQVELPWVGEFSRAKQAIRLPTVLGIQEVQQLLLYMEGTTGLVSRLRYGSGMRLLEVLRLRVKDVTTTQIYTHVLDRGGVGLLSPLDRVHTASLFAS